MRFTPDNFLYLIKQLVTGKNGDDTPDIGTLPGTSGGPGTSQAADGGIKKDVPYNLLSIAASAALPAITDSTGGTASTTFAAVPAGGTGAAAGAWDTSAHRDAAIAAINNNFAQIAKQLNALANQYAAASSGIPVVTVPANATAVGTVTFVVPREYDEASDTLGLRLTMAVANSADNAVTVTGTPTVQPIATGTAITVPTKTVSGKALAATVGQVPFTTTNAVLTITPQVFDINFSGYSLKRDDIVAVAISLTGTPPTNGNTYLYAVEWTLASTIVSYNETDATQSPNGTTANVLPGFGNPLR